LPTLRCRADQCEARFGILHLAQVRRAFGDDHFQRGPDVPFAEVPGLGAAVAGADDDVDVQGGFSFRIFSDVANQGGDLDLLADRNLLVFLLLPVEVDKTTSLRAPIAVKLAAWTFSRAANF
jgi:hypothetical protein